MRQSQVLDSLQQAISSCSVKDCEVSPYTLVQLVHWWWEFSHPFRHTLRNALNQCSTTVLLLMWYEECVQTTNTNMLWSLIQHHFIHVKGSFPWHKMSYTPYTVCVLKIATYQSSANITVAMDTAVDISLVKVMFLCLSTPDTLILQSITQDQQSRNMQRNTWLVLWLYESTCIPSRSWGWLKYH